MQFKSPYGRGGKTPLGLTVAQRQIGGRSAQAVGPARGVLGSRYSRPTTSAKPVDQTDFPFGNFSKDHGSERPSEPVQQFRPKQGSTSGPKTGTQRTLAAPNIRDVLQEATNIVELPEAVVADIQDRADALGKELGELLVDEAIIPMVGYHQAMAHIAVTLRDGLNLDPGSVDDDIERAFGTFLKIRVLEFLLQHIDTDDSEKKRWLDMFGRNMIRTTAQIIPTMSANDPVDVVGVIVGADGKPVEYTYGLRPGKRKRRIKDGSDGVEKS